MLGTLNFRGLEHWVPSEHSLEHNNNGVQVNVLSHCPFKNSAYFTSIFFLFSILFFLYQFLVFSLFLSTIKHYF